jgi:hypothetical protein
MNKPLDFNSKEILFPIFVILLSGFSIVFEHLHNLLSLSVLVSIIGIVGGVLFIYRYSVSTKLIYLWTIAQIIIVVPSFDVSQFLKLSLGFYSGQKGIHLNYLPLIYLGFMKIIEASVLVGKTITFTEFRAGGALGAIFPMKGTIIERVAIDKEKNYLLVELDSPFNYENQQITHVLTKAKDNEKTLKPGKKDQLAFFRVVEDKNDLIRPSMAKFPFVDWVYVR